MLITKNVLPYNTTAQGQTDKQKGRQHIAGTRTRVGGCADAGGIGCVCALWRRTACRGEGGIIINWRITI